MRPHDGTGGGGLVAKSCLTLVTPMDCGPPGSAVHGDSSGKKTGVDCHFLLQYGGVRGFIRQGKS